MTLFNMQHIPGKVQEFVRQHGKATAGDLVKAFGYTEGTSHTYLSLLAARGSIRRLSRGAYAPGKPANPPAPSPLAQEAYAAIRRRLPELPLAVWDAHLLSGFSHDSIMKSPIFVEVPKRYLDAARDALLGENITFKDVPVFDLEKVDLHEVFDLTPILLLERQERYGLVRLDGITTVRPERAWIDLLILTEKRGYPFAPAPLGEMLYRMVRDYDFNPGLFLRYAGRRHKRALLETFLWMLQQEGMLKGVALRKHAGCKKGAEELMRGVHYDSPF